MSSGASRVNVTPAVIKKYADFQINWNAAIEPLRRGRYTVESTEKRSIHGDAPKSFIRIKEYIPGHANRKVVRWPGYIAKVGSKRYPVESITEHLLTRLGQSLGVVIADSKLRIVAGQVRFLSKYFLGKNESLVHGLEIFGRHLDDEMVEEIAATRQEQDFYTFQTVLAAVTDIYPEHADLIMQGMVKLLAFDAIAGNNDRHPLNWGVVVPVAPSRPVRFAPIFDTARGLFWNVDDSQLGKFVASAISMDAYINKSVPQIGWDNKGKINHFDLINAIYRSYQRYRPILDGFRPIGPIDAYGKIVDDEFGELMSPIRRDAVTQCVVRRHELFCDQLV